MFKSRQTQKSDNFFNPTIYRSRLSQDRLYENNGDGAIMIFAKSSQRIIFLEYVDEDKVKVEKLFIPENQDGFYKESFSTETKLATAADWQLITIEKDQDIYSQITKLNNTLEKVGVYLFPKEKLQEFVKTVQNQNNVQGGDDVGDAISMHYKNVFNEELQLTESRSRGCSIL